MAFLAEQAGGYASDGHQSILEIQPTASASTGSALYWQS